jgi:mannose-6-phosphate isomerase-like protein (cupin superfamily)
VAATLIPRGDGEIIGDAPDRRVEILSDDDALNVTWSRFGPHRDGADLHIHRRHTDHFYVLEGELTVRLGIEDDRVAVPAGTLVRVPPLVVHGFCNGSDSEARFLNLHAPGRRFADYMRARRDGRTFTYDQEPPPPDGTRPATEAVVGGVEILVDRPGLRVALLADIEALAVAEVRSAPGGVAPPAHVHRRHVESFYVLEGELAFTLADGELRAGAGDWVQVPPDTAHTFAVAGETEVRFLDFHSPSCGFGDFARALHAAGDEGELRTARAAFDQEPSG